MTKNAQIHGIQQPIVKVFSSDYSFIIPNYQRPYSWKTDQTGQLLDDLTYFAFQEDNFNELKPYFIGSIVLIKEVDNPLAKVVDGQQRLTTLTILLAVLRELLPSLRNAITEIIYEKGNLIKGTENRFRLSLRERDNYFFDEYIQIENGISKLSTEIILTDSQAKIRDNALHLKKRIEEELTDKQRQRLTEYIVQKCYLVVVSTPDEESAYRIFSVLNNRGMQLSHADILKAEIIGAIQESEQETYTKKWEDMEEELGIDQFKDLFGHIRMINRKVKAKDTILKEIREHVKPTDRPKEFIENELIPYAEAYYAIKNGAFESASNAEKINHYLNWLNNLDNEDWIPPAIYFLSNWGSSDTKKVAYLLKRLERMAFGLYVMRSNINNRIERYGKILIASEKEDFKALRASLRFKKREIQDIKEALSGSVYGTQFVRYLLLRLDADFSEGDASYNHHILSIEHVLPQNPEDDSEWIHLFPDKEKREELTHCLGNLVLLSRRKNAKAQNYNFKRKKSSYFSKDGVTSFPLTTDVFNYEQWTPEVIRERQNELIERCQKIWKFGDDE